ncbi:hypothetical protein ACFRAQ_36150 [Nocardia sp. NPDC056611]|uniref:hypothetical protein n=1 Tax=Nocardia sp. NPDC056611 TaxID=3345877 RepID=UPI00366F8B94
MATGIATALATGVSTSLALYWRWRDRSEAEWHLGSPKSTWVEDSPYGNNEKPHASMQLVNVGDGTAFKIKITGNGTNMVLLNESQRRNGVPISVSQPVPVMRTGDAHALHIYCDPDKWDDATVTISWWHAPTQKKKRFFFWSLHQHHTVRLSELVAAPAKTTG